MSWQPAAFGVLAVALAAGFGWYERVRPDARIVALVATLAAFAALGRIAFAAVPNVKPTTDIVLISGYALGGGPGFAVGALAGLTSNFFFGQGPWTPWQMAAWGATGVIGAGLAWATSPAMRARLGWGRARPAGGQPWIGRWALAIVCCVVGFAFTAVQDVGDWVTYSDHSSAQLAVYVGKGLGFDAIHAAGCFAFALAFGPALTRSIQRFARRLQVTWVPSSAAAPLVALVLAAALTVGVPAPQNARAAAGGVEGPVSYLLRAQNADGGFGAAPGRSSNALYSGWAALGLASAGYDPARIWRRSRTVIDYLRSGAGLASDVGSIERTILVLGAAGLPARSFGGRDLVATLEHAVRRNGSVSDQTNLTSFAVLALRAAGLAPAARTLSLAGETAGFRRRLQLCGRRRAERCRRHRGGARSTGRGPRLRGGGGAGPGDRLPAPATGSRRWFPLPAGTGLQRTVDRLGGAGAGGGARRPGRPAPRRGRVAARVPSRFDRAERERRLRARQQPDPCLGDRGGADGAAAKAAAARRAPCGPPPGGGTGAVDRAAAIGLWLRDRGAARAGRPRVSRHPASSSATR